MQDAWHVFPKLTVTVGLRYTLLQTPYEENGQQLAPTINVHDWFETRAAKAAQGVTDQPDLYFAPSGQSRGLKPYWPAQHHEFCAAVRLRVRGKPEDLDSRRILDYTLTTSAKVSWTRSISLGLSGLRPPCRIRRIHTTWTIRRDLRASTICLRMRALSRRRLRIHTWLRTQRIAALRLPGVSIDRLKTPYSEVVDFSVQRQLPGGILLEADYVGPVRAAPAAAT